MDTALAKKTSAKPPAKKADKQSNKLVSNVKQNGNINTSVGYAETYIGNLNVVQGGNSNNAEIDNLLESALRTDLCNLFIIKGETFSVECFVISKDKALTHRSSEKFDVFDDIVFKLPSLFMDINGSSTFGQCSKADQCFYYGLVLKVEDQGKNLKICFKKLYNKPLLKQRLNEISIKIGINTDDGIDLLDHTNWLIRPIDIRKAMADNGIEYR